MENYYRKEFLQSEEWRRFQKAVGRRTFCIFPYPSPLPASPVHFAVRRAGGPEGEGDAGFYASIIEHRLPIAGKYFYIPRGPLLCHPELDSEPVPNSIQESNEIPDQVRNDNNIETGMTSLINLAKKENAGWIRIEPKDNNILDIIRNIIDIYRNKLRIVKSPHDVQPREILVMDITKPEEELLAEMKAKTRYNIKLSQKHNVSIYVIPARFAIATARRESRRAGIQKNRSPIKSKTSLLDSGSGAGMTFEYIDEFIRLVKITAKRDKITPHPESYYRKMFEVIPSNILKLYVAEYQDKVIAANIVIFYGNTATYLHGASDYNYRDLMAPHLLQWQTILDAKKDGFTKYDLGGIKSTYDLPASPARLAAKRAGRQPTTNDWSGITKFKTGFAPNTEPIQFPGSYDIIINPFRYNLYRFLQKAKSIF